MQDKHNNVPDSTAVRVALWRALHVEVDAPPHILEDDIGVKLVAPEEGWRQRGDMHPQGTAPFRASIVGRARFVEDFVTEQAHQGISQYVMLGAGLDTFAQRRPDIASKLQVFEVEKPSTQAWKQQRLQEIGFSTPSWLHFVPVDFESGESWWTKLAASGFDPKKPAIVTSMGVSMYLTLDAIKETLKQMMSLAPGSKFIMTFMLPLDLVDAQEKPGYEMSLKGAQRSGTPFISFFSPQEMLFLAKEAGFKKVEHFSTTDLVPKYFAGRADGLRPSTGEEFLVATT
ncbi:class I SAM-dependent methyltransferase [Bdellovibrio sp. 22V]|uniref:class I SAM-dependent methyltransferase n=1 Tax=Bdellovibrio sp. 22V TaxID=3044166 RepID=UPI00254296B6|nr:class I SAM-dependent methyltransferase [Bdellovibrio sp. 22V]WII72622.1 class I SAM-dependent methyltransferase [Bdellovibrio sp. 22V]